MGPGSHDLDWALANMSEKIHLALTKIYLLQKWENSSLKDLIKHYLNHLINMAIGKKVSNSSDCHVLEIYHGSQIPVNLGGCELQSSYIQCSYLAQ